MPIHSWKLPYLLIGVSLGYVILLQSQGFSSVPWPLLVLPITLFAAVWIRRKECILLAIALLDISFNIDRSYHLYEEAILSRLGYLVSITFIALAALYIWWFLKFCLYKERESRYASFPKFHTLVVFYVVTVLFSFLNSYNMYISSFEVFYQLQSLMLYFYLVKYISDESRFKYVINMLLIGLFFQSVIVFIQNVIGIQFDLIPSNEAREISGFTYGGNLEVFRPGGTFEAYNTLADYLTTLLFLALGYFFSQKNATGRFLVGACLALGTAALIMTHSRGAWAGFALGTVVFFIVSLRRRWITLKAGLVMLMTGALVILPFVTPIYLRLTESDGGSGFSRIPLMKLAWRIIHDHPLFGVGINNFGMIMQDYLTSEIRGEWLYVVHNRYLLIFAEMGFFGIVSYLLLMLGIIWLGARCVQADHQLLSPLALGIIASLICDAFHMMIDILDSRSSVEMFWTLAALSVVAYRLLYPDVRHDGSSLAKRRLASHPLTDLQQEPAG